MVDCIGGTGQENYPFVFSGPPYGLPLKNDLGVKYFPPDPHIGNRLGFPEPVKGPVADVQQPFDVCAVVISRAVRFLSVQAFKDLGKENQ